MKLGSWFLILCAFIVIGCAQETPSQIQDDQAEPIKVDEQSSPATIVQESASSGPELQETETSNVSIGQNASREKEEPITQPSNLASETKQKPPIPYPDSFDGTSIDADKYSLKIVGLGSITQNNEIVSSGNANDEIIWNILYTNENIDLSKDFTVTVDVNLTADVQRGDAMAILAVEPLDKIPDGKMPERNYCELSTGSSHGTILRTAKSGHGSKVSSTSGKMSVSFNALKEQFNCALDTFEVSEHKPLEFGTYVLTLRAGIHQISGSYEESGSTGSFTVKYDNLDLVAKKD